MRERIENIVGLVRYVILPIIYSILSFLAISIGQYANVRNELTLLFVLVISIAYLVKVTEITRMEENLLIKIVNFALFVLFASPILVYSIVLLISISPEFYIRVGTKDSWINFAGSIISGVLVMFALVFTIQHEDRARKEEYNERSKEIALTSIPIIILTNTVNSSKNLGSVCKRIDEDCYDLILFTSFEIKNISSYIAKNIKLRKIVFSKYAHFLDRAPENAIDCTKTYSTETCSILPQGMSHTIQARHDEIISSESYIELSIEITYEDYLEKFEHSISAKSMISVDKIVPLEQSPDYVKITFNFGDFMVNYIK